MISEGATFHDTIADCVKDAEAVITIVGFPTDVEEVYFDAGNILDSAKEGAYLIDMTTTSPMLDRRSQKKEPKEDSTYWTHRSPAVIPERRTVHSPSWSAVPETTTKPACRYSRRWAPTSTIRENPDAASTPKLANQIMIAGTLSGVCEALTYAKAKGLDLQTVLDSVSTGAAGSKQLDTFGPKILAGDYAPGFFLKHFVKDMKLALTEANMSNLNLDVLSQVLANYELLQAEGCGDLGTQALIKYYEEEMDA